MSENLDDLKKIADKAGAKTRTEEIPQTEGSANAAASAFSMILLMAILGVGLVGGLVFLGGGDRTSQSPSPEGEQEEFVEDDGERPIPSDGRLPQEVLATYSDLENGFRARVDKLERTLSEQKDNLSCATAVALREEVEAKVERNGTTEQIETMAIINDLILQIKMLNRYRATINPIGDRKSAPSEAVKELAGEIYTIAYQQYEKAEALEDWNNDIQQDIAFELAGQMLRKSDRQLLNDLLANLDAATRLLRMIHAGTTPTNPDKTQVVPNCRIDTIQLEGQLQLVSEDAETLYALIPEVQAAYRNITRGRSQPPSPTQQDDITFPFPVRATVGGE